MGQPLPSPHRTQATCGDRGGGQSDPAHHMVPIPTFSLLLPCLSPSCHQPQGEAGRANTLEMLHKTRVCPGSQVTQRPAGPVSCEPCQGLAPTALASPLPCQQARRGPRARADCFQPAQPCSPGEGLSVPTPAVATAWLGGTRSQAARSPGLRGIHLQPHQLPGNRIPAADDSRAATELLAPLQRPVEPAWHDLAAASAPRPSTPQVLTAQCWRCPDRLPRPHPGAARWDGGTGTCPYLGAQDRCEGGLRRGRGPCSTCRASRNPGCLYRHRELRASLRGGSPHRSQHASGESYCTHFRDGSGEGSLGNK